MQTFGYGRPSTIEDAVLELKRDPSVSVLAGGTTEVDLWRLGIRQASRVVDINRLPLTTIKTRSDEGLTIGALARMSDVAADGRVRTGWPMITQALELGASAQLRNMASMGGNMRQAVRCGYYRDIHSPCNKRVPGTGCAALEGFNRGHAVLGTSAHCIATHPSDVAVALVAADAAIHLKSSSGDREVAVGDFFLLPGDTPDREHDIAHGELIVAISLPPLPVARSSTYLKVRDRQSYEFALTSAAAAMSVRDGRIQEARLALGGVATKPWRATKAEAALIGQPATADSYRAAAELELADAVPQSMNGFKIELAKRTITRVFEMLGKSQ